MKITYSPPKGEDRSVVYYDVEFFAGQPNEVDEAEHPLLAKKVKGNALFTVEADGEDAGDEPKRRGRPPKVKADGEDAA